jgi:cytochrome c
MVNFRLSFLIVSFVLVFSGFISVPALKTHIENHSPRVTISLPANNGTFTWNSTIRYKITVTDQEDGSSDYNEIVGNEVLLKVLYVPDASKAGQYLSAMTKENSEHPGLTLLKSSDCLNCHAAKNKLIGPSFDLIAEKYPYSSGAVNALTKKVVNGTLGTWGDTPMPPHPMLKTKEARQIIEWILTNNLNPDLSFLPGTEGVLRTKEMPQNKKRQAAYVLVASYMDHGVGGPAGVRKYGQQAVLLRSAK